MLGYRVVNPIGKAILPVKPISQIRLTLRQQSLKSFFNPNEPIDTPLRGHFQMPRNEAGGWQGGYAGHRRAWDTDLFFFFSFYYWGIVDTQCSVSFRCATQWFDKSIHSAPHGNCFTIWCHTTLLWYYWLYPLGCTCHLCNFFYFVTGSLNS